MKMKKTTLLSLALCALNSQVWAMREPSFKLPSTVEPVTPRTRLHDLDVPGRPHLFDGPTTHQGPRASKSTPTLPKLITAPNRTVTNPVTTTTDVASGDGSGLQHLSVRDITAIRNAETGNDFNDTVKREGSDEIREWKEKAKEAREAMAKKRAEDMKIQKEKEELLKKQRQAERPERMKQLMENKTFGPQLTNLNLLLKTALTKSLFPEDNPDINRITANFDLYLNGDGNNSGQGGGLLGLKDKPGSKKVAQELEKQILAKIEKAISDVRKAISNIDSVLETKASEMAFTPRSNRVFKEKEYTAWNEAPENIQDLHTQLTTVRDIVKEKIMKGKALKLSDYVTMEKLEKELLTALDEAPTFSEFKSDALEKASNTNVKTALRNKGYTSWKEAPKNLEHFHTSFTTARIKVLDDIAGDSSELSKDLVALKQAEDNLLSELQKAPTLEQLQAKRITEKPVLDKLQEKLNEKMEALSLSPEEKAMLEEQLTELFNQKIDEGTITLDTGHQSEVTRDYNVLSRIVMEAEKIDRAKLKEKQALETRTIDTDRKAFLGELLKTSNGQKLSADQQKALTHFVDDYISEKTPNYKADLPLIKEEAMTYITEMVGSKKAVIEGPFGIYTPKGKEDANY